jgi:hypothetical protein
MECCRIWISSKKIFRRIYFLHVQLCWPPVYLSILSPAQLGPRQARLPTLLAGVGRDLEAREKILARAQSEMLFLVILNYKIRGRPAQVRSPP